MSAVPTERNAFCNGLFTFLPGFSPGFPIDLVPCQRDVSMGGGEALSSLLVGGMLFAVSEWPFIQKLALLLVVMGGRRVEPLPGPSSCVVWHELGYRDSGIHQVLTKQKNKHPPNTVVDLVWFSGSLSVMWCLLLIFL